MLFLLDNVTMLDGKLTTTLHISLGQLDVHSQRQQLEMDPEPVLSSILDPKFFEKRLGFVELASQSESDDQIKVENVSNRVEIFVRVRVFVRVCSDVTEGDVLNVGRVQVVRGL